MRWTPLILAVCVGCSAAAAPKKLALVVGIDKYGASAKVPPAEQWMELSGSANDAKAMRQQLERRGFEVKVLLDEQATRQGIIDAFRAHLVAGAEGGRGDVALFHYSGHGQQVPDVEPIDEADGYDESLVPFDNRGVKDPSNNLRDDELNTLLQELRQKTPNVVVFLDSCNSGTGTRGRLKARGMPPTLPPATARGSDIDGASGLLSRGAADQAGYVLLSAVRADQFAKEATDPVSGAEMGAFTYLLVRALDEASPKSTYRELLDRVGVQILGITSDQNPQGEGDVNKVLFSGDWAAQPTHFRVLPVGADGRFEVEAGSLHGLSPGSVLAIFPHGADVRDPSRAAAKVKLESVELGRAFGKASPPGLADKKLLAAGGQAVEVYAEHAPSPLKVAVDPPAKAVAPVLKSLGFAVLVDAKQGWDVRVTVEPESGRVQLMRSDGTPIFVPTGKNGPLERAVTADARLPARVALALEAQYRRDRLLALHNDDPATRLPVELSIARVEAVLETTPSGARRPRITRVLETMAKDGTGRLMLGDIVQFQVQNRGAMPAHFTIFELSSDGSIGALYPSQQFGAGENVVAPGAARAIEVPFKMTPPEGPQIFKVIATEDDIDFRALELKLPAAQRGAPRSALERLMGEVFAGRRSEPFGYGPQKHWGTDAARVELVAAAARPPPGKLAVMVLHFDNNTGDARYDVLEKGLADMVLTDLCAAPALQLVERDRLDEVLAELKLQHTPQFDPATAQRLGRLVGAQYAVAGALASVEPELRLDIRLVEVATARILLADKITGDKERLFALEEQLVEKFIGGLGVSVARSRGARGGLPDAAALLAYSRAVEAAERGHREEAQRLLEAVLRAAPDFRPAVALARRLAADAGAR